MVYSQIWLHLIKDGSQFFYMFLWMIAILAISKYPLKKTLALVFGFKFLGGINMKKLQI